MIFFSLVINSSGLVIQTGRATYRPLEKRLSGDILSSIFDYRGTHGSYKQISDKIVFKIQKNALARVYFFSDDQILVVYSRDTTEDLIKEQVDIISKERENLKNRLKGIIIGWMDDDEGPTPIYNNTGILESAEVLLVLQGSTMTGMGNEFLVGLFGPMPIPQENTLESLNYNFLISAPESKDSRIKTLGRPCFLFLVFNKDDVLLHSLAFRSSLKSYLDVIISDQIDHLNFDPLWKTIQSSFILAADLDFLHWFAEEKIKESESRYRTIFEESPISIWEEDFSEVAQYFKKIRGHGITDFREYFKQNPKNVALCAGMAKITDVNKKTLELYKAKSKEEFIGNLEKVFTKESYLTFQDELIALANGETKYKKETVNKTLTGKTIYVRLNLIVCPGYEKTLGKVIVSVEDISQREK